MSSESQTTRERLLDCAELLFADHGIAQVSLRKIVAEARVNVASVNYHFGSKDELIQEVFRRRITRVNAVRLAELNRLKSAYAAEPIPVVELLRAFLSPVLKMGREEERGRNFFRLVARAHAETNEVVQQELYSNLKEIVQLFITELRRSLPDLSAQELSMRLAFTAGAMVQTVLMPMHSLFGDVSEQDESKIVDRLVDYAVGGMTARRGERELNGTKRGAKT